MAGKMHFDTHRFAKHMIDVDKDFRQMALFDLGQAASADNVSFTKTDEDIIMNALKACFSEKETNLEVQNDAVSTLPKVFGKVSSKWQIGITTILIEILNSPVVNDHVEHAYSIRREQAALALKLVGECIVFRSKSDMEAMQLLAPTMTHIVSSCSNALEVAPSTMVRCYLYDVVTELLDTIYMFPPEVTRSLSTTAMVDFQTPQVRRRVALCLARLCTHLRQDALSAVIAFVTEGLRSPTTAGLVHFAQLVEALVRLSPKRLHQLAQMSLSAFVACLEQAVTDDTVGDELLDVAENTLRAVETLITKCPACITRDFEDRLVTIAVRLATANLRDSAGSDSINSMEDSLGDYDFVEDNVDEQWKVRIWGCRVLSAIISQRSHTPAVLSAVLSGGVLNLATDRMEHVALEGLGVIRAALHAPAAAVELASSAECLLRNDAYSTLAKAATSNVEKIAALSLQLFQLLLSCAEQPLSADVVKSACHSVLANIAKRSSQQCIPAKVEAIQLARVLFTTLIRSENRGCLAEEAVADKVASTVAAVIEACTDSAPKVALTSLASYDEIAATTSVLSQQRPALAEKCANSIVAIAAGKVVDCKPEAASRAAGEIVTCLNVLGSLVSPSTRADLGESLLAALLREDLVGACSAAILACPTGVVDGGFASAVGQQLVSVLPKVLDRCIKGTILRALCVLIAADPEALKGPAVAMLSSATSGIVEYLSAAEVGLATAMLRLAAQMVVQYPQTIDDLVAVLEPSVHAFLLETPSKEHVEKEISFFYQTLSTARPDCRATYVATCIDAVNHYAYPVTLLMAVVVGAVCSTDEGTASATAVKVLSGVSRPAGAALLLGEVGLHCELSAEAHAALTAALRTADDAVRAPIVTAVGRAASSMKNRALLDRLLQVVVENAHGGRHAALTAIREAASIAHRLRTPSIFEDQAECAALCEQLLSLQQNEDDNIDIVGACLGSIALFNLGQTVARLMHRAENQTSTDAVRATVLAALKYLIVSVTASSNNSDLPLLCDVVPRALSLLHDDATVLQRSAALHLFAAAASSAPELLMVNLVKKTVVPEVVKNLAVDARLVTVIDLGSYKHRVDKGLIVRKQAYECVVSVLGHDERYPQMRLLDYFDANKDLLRSLVGGCGPLNAGEVEPDLHNIAKMCVARLVVMYPAVPVDVETIGCLARKLKASIETTVENSPDSEKVLSGIRRSICCAMSISRCGAFAESDAISEVALLALNSALLPSAMKLM